MFLIRVFYIRQGTHGFLLFDLLQIRLTLWIFPCNLGIANEITHKHNTTNKMATTTKTTPSTKVQENKIPLNEVELTELFDYSVDLRLFVDPNSKTRAPGTITIEKPPAASKRKGANTDILAFDKFIQKYQISPINPRDLSALSSILEFGVPALYSQEIETKTPQEGQDKYDSFSSLCDRLAEKSKGKEIINLMQLLQEEYDTYIPQFNLGSDDETLLGLILSTLTLDSMFLHALPEDTPLYEKGKFVLYAIDKGILYFNSQADLENKSIDYGLTLLRLFSMSHVFHWQYHITVDPSFNLFTVTGYDNNLVIVDGNSRTTFTKTFLKYLQAEKLILAGKKPDEQIITSLDNLAVTFKPIVFITEDNDKGGKDANDVFVNLYRSHISHNSSRVFDPIQMILSLEKFYFDQFEPNCTYTTARGERKPLVAFIQMLRRKRISPTPPQASDGAIDKSYSRLRLWIQMPTILKSIAKANEDVTISYQLVKGVYDATNTLYESKLLEHLGRQEPFIAIQESLTMAHVLETNFSKEKGIKPTIWEYESAEVWLQRAFDDASNKAREGLFKYSKTNLIPCTSVAFDCIAQSFVTECCQALGVITEPAEPPTIVPPEPTNNGDNESGNSDANSQENSTQSSRKDFDWIISDVSESQVTKSLYDNNPIGLGIYRKLVESPDLFVKVVETVDDSLTAFENVAKRAGNFLVPSKCGHQAVAQATALIDEMNAYATKIKSLAAKLTQLEEMTEAQQTTIEEAIATAESAEQAKTESPF